MTAQLSYAQRNQYDTYSKFESISDFNNQFEQAMILHKDEFTKAEYIALNKLRKYAADMYGVAWCKIQTVVASTHEALMFGVSRTTFERMIRKAKKINLITVINQKRRNNRQKHNLYVFNTLDELVVEEPEIVSISHTIAVPKPLTIDVPRTNNLLELPILKDYNTYPQAENVPLSSETVINFQEKKTDYQQLTDLIANLFSDIKITYRIYGVWLGQTKKMISPPSFELALMAIKALILEIKRRIAGDLPALHNPVGYFNGILKKMIDSWLENEIARYENDWEAAMIEDGFENELTQLTPLVQESDCSKDDPFDSVRPIYNWLEDYEK